MDWHRTFGPISRRKRWDFKIVPQSRSHLSCQYFDVTLILTFQNRAKMKYLAPSLHCEFSVNKHHTQTRCKRAPEMSSFVYLEIPRSILDGPYDMTKYHMIWKRKWSGSGFRSACDFPSSTYFEDLLRLYPNAKVILTIRDSPQQWINSVKDTIFAEKFGNGNKFSGRSFEKVQSLQIK